MIGTSKDTMLTFCNNAVRVINERPFTALSDDHRDFTVVIPASLLTPDLDPYPPVGTAHEKDHLKRDYRFSLVLVDKFWRDWVAFYLPTLQGRNKWREVAENLQEGRLVMVGDSKDLAKRRRYRVERVTEVFPKKRHGKLIVPQKRHGKLSEG